MGILEILSALLPSGECFILGWTISGVVYHLYLVASAMYIAESVDDSSRGFATAFGHFVASIGASVMFALCRPSMLGTFDKWLWMPIIGLVHAAMLIISMCSIPESPKWLANNYRIEEAKKAIVFFHGTEEGVDEKISKMIKERDSVKVESMSLQEVWNDSLCREGFLIILAFDLESIISRGQAERVYPVLLHEVLGIKAEQSLMIASVLLIVSLPFILMGSFLLDKIGRRPVLFLAAGITYTKLILLTIATFISYFSGPNWFTVFVGFATPIANNLIGATGVNALFSLMIVELLPPAARVVVAQTAHLIPLILSIPITSLYPILLNLFPPAFYILFLVAQPIILLYLFIHYPETKQRPVADILEEMNQEVRSRQNTVRSRRSTMKSRSSTVNERTLLLEKKNTIVSSELA